MRDYGKPPNQTDDNFNRFISPFTEDEVDIVVVQRKWKRAEDTLKIANDILRALPSASKGSFVQISASHLNDLKKWAHDPR